MLVAILCPPAALLALVVFSVIDLRHATRLSDEARLEAERRWAAGVDVEDFAGD